MNNYLYNIYSTIFDKNNDIFDYSQVFKEKIEEKAIRAAKDITDQSQIIDTKLLDNHPPHPKNHP